MLKIEFSSYITNLQIALSFVYFCTAHYIILTVKSFTEQSPYNSVHFSFLLSAQSIYPHYTTIIKRHGQARPEHPKKSTISDMPFSIAPPISLPSLGQPLSSFSRVRTKRVSPALEQGSVEGRQSVSIFVSLHLPATRTCTKAWKARETAHPTPEAWRRPTRSP